MDPFFTLPEGVVGQMITDYRGEGVQKWSKFDYVIYEWSLKDEKEK